MATDNFQRRRLTGIGGSDAAAVLGISPWRSRLGLWEEKIGLRPPSAPSERMVWGSRLEDAVAKGWADDYKVSVRKVGFRRHAAYPFLIGHPDRSLGEDRGLEIKTSDRLGDEWGEEGSDKIPPHYWTQVQHYMVLMGWWSMDVAVLVRGNELHSYTVPADFEFQANLVTEEGIFWGENVLAGIPPDPDGSEDAQAVIRRRFRQSIEKDTIVATPQVDLLGRRLLDVKESIGVLEIEERELQSRIMAYIGIHGGVTGDGWSATWGNRKGSISWKTVAEVYRRIIERTAFDFLGKRGPLLLTEGLKDQEETPGGVQIENMKDLQTFLDTVEGLYRGEPSRQFSPRRKGQEGMEIDGSDA